MTRTLQGRLAMLAGGLISTGAMADLPQALDLVPADAPVVVAIDNFNALLGERGAVAQLAGALGPIPADLAEIQQLGRLEGVNAGGSLAAVMVPAEGFGEEDQLVVIAPVSDYAAFARGLGGSGAGLEEVELDGEPLFIKSLGGGYAAMGPQRDPVEGFEARAGQLGGHKERLGKTGEEIAGRSQLLVIANMSRVGGQLQQQIAGSLMGAQMFAPPGAADGLKALQAGLTRLINDAKTGILGVGLNDAGVTLHFGAAFSEGTEMAGLFDGDGNSAALMKRLPDQPYLVAGAMDLSNPKMKDLMVRMNEMSARQADAGALSAMMEKADGSAFLLGAFGMHQMAAGIFVNSVAYVQSEDPKALMADFRKSQEAMNGQEAEGIRITTTYEPGARDLEGGGVADAWGMQMEPTDPMAMGGEAQMMAMMFGPSGLGGYIAPSEGGVCLTYARNSKILALAMETAKAADGLGAGDQLQAVASALPASRTAEFYIDVDEALKLGAVAMQMMGGDLPVDAQADLMPIAFGAGGSGGGAHVALHIPSQTLQTLARTFRAMAGDMMMMEPDAGGGPDF
jgi:hypothetical protein